LLGRFFVKAERAVALSLTAHHAAALNARTPSGRLRGVARKVAHTRLNDSLSDAPPMQTAPPGRVASAGVWQSEQVYATLAGALGSRFAPSLRRQFEWYLARGAFFHNDAHYEDVLFGIWCVAGPPAELVFPRLGLRLDAAPGALAIFDPFEVHGLLSPGRTAYAAADYMQSAPSVFVGFELELAPAVAAAFEVEPAGDAPTMSSATRIDAATGAVV
jgi:hypothetical protein